MSASTTEAILPEAGLRAEIRLLGQLLGETARYWEEGGLENVGNLQYREHLDLRTGMGVFQPGVNFYFGMKVMY